MNTNIIVYYANGSQYKGKYKMIQSTEQINQNTHTHNTPHNKANKGLDSTKYCIQTTYNIYDFTLTGIIHTTW